MAIRNVELMQECFPKHSHMGTAKMKYDKETEEEVRREERVWKEVKRSRKKKKSPKGVNHSSGLPPPRGLYAPKQNELHNEPQGNVG